MSASELQPKPGVLPSPPRPALDSRLQLFPLAMRREDDEVIVGRVDMGEFIALPEVGGRAIELLQQGRSLRETEAQLVDEMGAEVDLQDFSLSLIDLKFVQAIDDRALAVEAPPRPSLAWLKPSYVRWVFGWPLKLVYAALLFFAAVTLALNLDLLPAYQDFIWSDIISIAILANTAFSWTNLAMHEFSHLIAARSLGVPAFIQLSTRLTTLVVHTDVTGLWSVPRKRRYRVYLAGMAWDLIPLSFAILLRAYLPLPELVDSFLAAVMLLNFLGIVWQFYVYMRTDMYFVLLDLMRCHNLFQDSLDYLKYFFGRFGSKLRRNAKLSVNPLDAIPAHEVPKVRIYAFLMLVGSIFSLGTFAIIGLPITFGLLSGAMTSVLDGLQTGAIVKLLDGLITLGIVAIFQVLLIVMLIRNHGPRLVAFLKSRRRRTQTPARQQPGETTPALTPIHDLSDTTARFRYLLAQAAEHSLSGPALHSVLGELPGETRALLHSALIEGRRPTRVEVESSAFAEPVTAPILAVAPKTLEPVAESIPEPMISTPAPQASPPVGDPAEIWFHGIAENTPSVADRFRSLLASQQDPLSPTWAQEMAQELPAEARELLLQSSLERNPAANPALPPPDAANQVGEAFRALLSGRYAGERRAWFCSSLGKLPPPGSQTPEEQPAPIRPTEVADRFRFMLQQTGAGRNQAWFESKDQPYRARMRSRLAQIESLPSTQ